MAIADKDEDEANKLVHEINHGNGKAMAFPGDLLDQNYSDNLANEVKEKLGSIDILINNAGLMRRGDICLLYTSPSPRDRQKSRMPSSA